MKHDPADGVPVEHTVNVALECEHCGTVMRVVMTPAEAREHAETILASAADLDFVNVGVAGPRRQG